MIDGETIKAIRGLIKMAENAEKNYISEITLPTKAVMVLCQTILELNNEKNER